MEKFSSDDLIVLKSVFRKYDTEHKGYLNRKQFTLFLSGLGKYVKEVKEVVFETTNAVFAYIDKNADGILDFEEFCKWWNSPDKYDYFADKKSKKLREVYKLYEKYSIPGKGITFSQFGKMMKSLNIEYTEDEFEILDKDDNEKLSFEEFCQLINWF